VGPIARVWEKHMMKLLGAPKLRCDRVWYPVSFLLFLVKLPSDKGSQTQDKLYDELY